MLLFGVALMIGGIAIGALLIMAAMNSPISDLSSFALAICAGAFCIGALLAIVGLFA